MKRFIGQLGLATVITVSGVGSSKAQECNQSQLNYIAEAAQAICGGVGSDPATRSSIQAAISVWAARLGGIGVKFSTDHEHLATDAIHARDCRLAIWRDLATSCLTQQRLKDAEARWRAEQAETLAEEEKLKKLSAQSAVQKAQANAAAKAALDKETQEMIDDLIRD